MGMTTGRCSRYPSAISTRREIDGICREVPAAIPRPEDAIPARTVDLGFEAAFAASGRSLSGIALFSTIGATCLLDIKILLIPCRQLVISIFSFVTSLFNTYVAGIITKIRTRYKSRHTLLKRSPPENRIRLIIFPPTNSKTHVINVI